MFHCTPNVCSDLHIVHIMKLTVPRNNGSRQIKLTVLSANTYNVEQHKSMYGECGWIYSRCSFTFYLGAY